MALDKKNILIGVGVAVAVAIVVGVVIFLAVYFGRRSSSSSDRLSTPVGEMTPVTGPYHSYNGIPGLTTTGHIYESRYPEKDIFSRYGYRAVYTKSGEVVDTNKRSAIKWNEKVYKVMTFEEEEREDSGFSFKISKQGSGLIASNIDYELVANVYDNPAGSGTPLYEELILDRIKSESEELIVLETDDKTDNKLLIS